MYFDEDKFAIVSYEVGLIRIDVHLLCQWKVKSTKPAQKPTSYSVSRPLPVGSLGSIQCKITSFC